jgi:hypothetical protein
MEISEVQPVSGDKAVHGKDYKSAVTNGKRLHVNRPGDNAWGRRFRDIYQLLIEDLGGSDRVSEGQRQLARRCATLCIACERMEGDAAAGLDIELERYGAMCDRLGRALQRLGLQKYCKDITATFATLRAQLDSEPVPDEPIDVPATDPPPDAAPPPQPQSRKPADVDEDATDEVVP